MVEALAERWEAAQQQFQQKVRTFARNSIRGIPHCELVDLEQELLVVLWECVVNYDPNKGATFNTYWQQSAKNRMISLTRHYSTKSRTGTTVSLDVESVESAVDEYISETSAEELALMRMDIQSYTLENGMNGWAEDRGRRRKAS